MPTYRITIHQIAFGDRHYIDGEDIKCKTKNEANKYAKDMLGYHKNRNKFAKYVSNVRRI